MTVMEKLQEAVIKAQGREIIVLESLLTAHRLQDQRKADSALAELDLARKATKLAKKRLEDLI